MTSQQHTPQATVKGRFTFNDFLLLIVVLVLGCVAFQVVISAASWYNESRVGAYEQALANGEIKDDQATVIELPRGDGSGLTRFYKLGTSDYANGLRRAGIGCRLLMGGSILSFESLKPGEAVPQNIAARVTYINGECDGKNQPQVTVDLSKAFQ